MVTLRDRSTIKRALKLRDAAEGGAAASEVPAAKRQKKAPATTQGDKTSTTSTKPKVSKSRQAAGERSEKRNMRAETLAKKAKSQGKKDDLAPAPAATHVATTAAAAANNTNVPAATTAAANKAGEKGKKKQHESETKHKSTEPKVATATTTTADDPDGKGKKKPEGNAKTKSTEPEASHANVAHTKSSGKKRKPEADAPEPEKEDDASVDREEAGKKPGRSRKRQAVQDIRKTDEQSSQQKDDPPPEPRVGSAPTKGNDCRQASRKNVVEDIKTSRNGRKPLTEASDSSKAQRASKGTEPQGEDHKWARARSLTAEPSKTLVHGQGAETKRTKIVLKMPTATRPRQQRTPAVVPERPIAEPEVAKLEEAERHRPLGVASTPSVSNPIDSCNVQATGEVDEEAEAAAEVDPAVAGNPSPARKPESARAKACQPKATHTAEQEDVPELSTFAQSKLDSIRHFKVASFRGGAPGKPDPTLKLPPIKKNKPVSAAEEVRRTEQWAKSFLQEQNEDESPAAVEARHEILREKVMMCPRSKLAARRFKARLRAWSIRNGIQPAFADAAMDEAVEQARGEQHAFLELTKDSWKDLEKLDE
ncbi:hypothetical protein DV736_g4871, partial [Chaetothyriales sp. CBS 134916]